MIEDLVKTLGIPVGLMVVAFWAGYKGIWVWGRELTNAVAEKDRALKGESEWQQVALASTSVAETLAAIRKEAKA